MTAPSLKDEVNSLEKYQKFSRLHFIGQWKTRMKDYLKGCFVKHPSWNHGKLKQQKTFIHMDLDAFFCSVQLAKPKYALLRDKPVAVAAGNANSDISSCNYVARQFGVHAGMYVNRARELCPDLVTIGYDFESCEKIVKVFYECIFESVNTAVFHIALEVYSVDDVMVATDTDDNAVLVEYCNTVREKLKASTGCTASCGIGPNILTARLVTSLAKPDGVYVLRAADVRAFISQTPFDDIHGAGESTVEKVRNAFSEMRHDVSESALTCRTVQLLSMEKLQSILGKKLGANFFALCRGEDDRTVHRTGDPEEEAEARKSINAVACSMNYSIRAVCEEDLWKVMDAVLQSVCEKLQRHNFATGALRLTVLERLPLQPKEPQKYLGRGKCLEVHLPVPLPRPLSGSDPTDVQEMTTALQRSLRPLLVASRTGKDGHVISDEERATYLGVLDQTTNQTTWTVSLPKVENFVLEDVRGITIQASKLQPLEDAAVNRKRARDSSSGKQRTLGELFALNEAPSVVGSAPIHSIHSSPREVRRQRGSKIEVSHEGFLRLLSMPYSETYIQQWKEFVTSVGSHDHFIVKACLRSAMLKILNYTPNLSEDGPTGSAALTEVAWRAKQMIMLKTFTKASTGHDIHYQ